MKKIFILFAVLFSVCTGSVSAQSEVEAPNWDEIKRATFDYDSPMYYPKLMKRYEQNDTTLNLEEYRNLYLGYSFQEAYNPYRENKYAEKLESIYSLDDYNQNNCDTIIKYALLSIDDFPFDLRQINMLIYAYKCKGQVEEEKKWSYKLSGILDAILSTGDGESPETAWYVIRTSHEYNIINRLGLSVTKYSFLDPVYDYLDVDQNPYKIKGFYFNVGRILEEYKRKYGDPI